MISAMNVGPLPERKRPCLWVQDGCEIRILANFKSDEAMREFLSLKPTYTAPQRTAS